MFAYGPVPSRRLGSSIGVSLIPHKTCTYSCIYCQLGRTDKMTVERKSFFPVEDILKDIRSVVENNSGADYITFAGDGEPTLNKDIGLILQECKNEWNIPTAVITNSSLLWNTAVREEVGKADTVLATLSAGTVESFRKIHRPHPSIIFENVIDGLKKFKEEASSELWAEIMLVKDVNDSKSELNKIAELIQSIQPNRLHVTTPFRPPAESYARPPHPSKVLLAYEIIGRVMPIEPSQDREEGLFGSGEFKDAREAIMETCSRHPLREEQARKIEKSFGESVLEDLISEGLITIEEYGGSIFVFPSFFHKKEGRASDKMINLEVKK